MFADELDQMMLDAQKEAYGNGLDTEYLHPSMWICKQHYYFAGLDFYNFPYAFGGGVCARAVCEISGGRRSIFAGVPRTLKGDGNLQRGRCSGNGGH